MTALPLPARLYIRAKDLDRVAPAHRPVFRTKVVSGVELVRWAVVWRTMPGKPRRVVADGAYAQAAVLDPVIRPGVTVVGRLRRDAARWTEPGSRRVGQRGRRRIDGDWRIALAKRAGQARGWSTGAFTPYGASTTKRYQTLVATGRPAGGRSEWFWPTSRRGGGAYARTAPTATAAQVLTRVADRFSRETAFRDVEHVVGAGRPPARFLWANIGAFHPCLWTFTTTGVRAWKTGTDERVGHRPAPPWDDEPRRPSHADKRRARPRGLMGEEIRTGWRAGRSGEEKQDPLERLLNLALSA